MWKYISQVGRCGYVRNCVAVFKWEGTHGSLIIHISVIFCFVAYMVAQHL